MAHSLSAKKRIRQNEKQRAHNRWRKREVRGGIREYQELILHGTVEEAEQKLSQLYKALDHAVARGPLHKNAASRTKARLAARLNRKRTQAGAA